MELKKIHQLAYQFANKLTEGACEHLIKESLDWESSPLEPSLDLMAEQALFKACYFGFIAGVRSKLAGETRIIVEPDEVMGNIPLVECCKIGPIRNENYCPNCGNKIIKDS